MSETRGTMAGADDVLATLRNAALLAGRLDVALAAEGLSTDQWRALVVIERTSGCAMAGIIEALAVPSTTATRIVDALVDTGSVFRAPDPTDRRRVMITLSTHGKTLLRRVEPVALAAAEAPDSAVIGQAG